MRAGRPAHPGCTWFSVPGSWFSVRDARAPRGHVVLGSWFLVLGSGRPRSQGARGSRFLVLGSRFGTPALPGTLSAVAPQGLPRAQRGLQPAVSACGRGRPRTQDARGSQFLVPGSRFGTPAPPGCAWFSVITGMVRDWCQAGSRVIGSVILRTLCPFIPLLSSVEFLGEMSDVLHSRAPLPLIPPTPFSHKGRRGSLSVLMAETGDGTQGLAKKLSL